MSTDLRRDGSALRIVLITLAALHVLGISAALAWKYRPHFSSSAHHAMSQHVSWFSPSDFLTDETPSNVNLVITVQRLTNLGASGPVSLSQLPSFNHIPASDVAALKKDFDAVDQKIALWLRNQWHAPAQAPHPNSRARLRLAVEPDGSLSGCAIERPSGQTELDESIEQAGAALRGRKVTMPATWRAAYDVSVEFRFP